MRGAGTVHSAGLLRMWPAENNIGDIDPTPAKLLDERRTDIVYGWNDASKKFELVFEFKRLRKQSRTGTSIWARTALPVSSLAYTAVTKRPPPWSEFS